MKEFRIIIAGGRDFNNYELLKAKCESILSSKATTHRIIIVSGAAKGADSLGEKYAREKGYATESRPADWNTHGKAAGYIRNAQMADGADALIAFWDGHSRGTKHMIDTANHKGLEVRTIIYNNMSKEEKSMQGHVSTLNQTDSRIDHLKAQTAQYAIEHITGKGMHTGIAWLRDSFNELCEAMHANEYNPNDLSFEIDDLVDNLKKAPWVSEIAAKPADKRTTADIDRVVNDFICEHWLMQPEEVTSKNVADVLKVADPLSHRHLVGQKVAIDCIHALDHEQLQQLDTVLSDIARNPSEGRGVGR